MKSRDWLTEQASEQVKIRISLENLSLLSLSFDNEGDANSWWSQRTRELNSLARVGSVSPPSNPSLTNDPVLPSFLPVAVVRKQDGGGVVCTASRQCPLLLKEE